MRRHFLSALLVAAAALVALTAPQAADKAPPSEPTPIKLPASFTGGMVCGDDGCVYVVAQGQLTAVHLATQKIKTLTAAGDKLLPFVDAANGLACVAGGDRVHVIDVVNDKAISSVDVKGTIRGLGLVAPTQGFVRTDTTVTVFDVQSGKVRHTVELTDKPPTERPQPTQHCLYRGRLYLPSAFDGSLAIVDLENGQVLDRIATNDWRVGGVAVTGDRAFVVGLRLGYGVWANSLAALDLKTKKWTALKLPAALLHASRLAVGPDGTLFLTDENQ